jgi:hypothetical protein
MYYASGDDGGPVEPHMVAELDQRGAATLDHINSLMSLHTAMHVFVHLDDGTDHSARVEQLMRQAGQHMMSLDQMQALSVLGSLAARLARIWVNHHGGPQAVWESYLKRTDGPPPWQPCGHPNCPYPGGVDDATA